MKAFVTGGTGFLGRHLIDALLAQGDDVTSLVRTIDRARRLPPAVRTLAGDLTRPAALRAALRGADVVYHLAALRRVGLPPKDYARLERTNVDGTRALLTLAGELGVPRLVYASDLVIYGDTAGRPVDESAPLTAPPAASAYAQSKYRAHVQAALPLVQQGLPLTIVCLGALYGPGDAGQLGGLLRRYTLGRLPVGLGGESAFSFTHAADAAAGLRLAATRGAPGETYFLAGPALTLRAFLAEGERATGLPAPRLWLPAAVARLLAQALRPLRPAAAERLRTYAGAASALGAGTKALRDLGWLARPAADGLPDTVAWYEAREREAQAAARLPPVHEPP